MEHECMACHTKVIGNGWIGRVRAICFVCTLAILNNLVGDVKVN